ncbi:hypothetical protein SCE1572_35635 [Sorangium cellulosum So0157-2]|uniref:Uncharacterized protein n=1 Tax=Sorangium cellulosum So0157-2 TaxID=1254432 RepID=S4Y1I2_SORCE|nr:hypothetical protein SCE1572_35635 [Sorangium cellulosum So0157-2]
MILRTREGWAHLRVEIPRSDAEISAIAGKVAPYLR